MTIVRAAAVLLSALLAAPVSAAISREDLKQALEANPDLIVGALKKANKTQLFEIIVQAQMEFQRKQQEDEAKREAAEREAAIKNPLKADLSDSRSRGEKDAPITIVEYSDFQCPYCKQGYRNVETLRKKYGPKMRVYFKNFPLNFHPQAMPAAQWFEAIALQSEEKAWAFHDALFENQDKLGEEYYKALAKDLKIDVKKAEADAKSERVAKKIEADVAEAKKFGIEGTPAYLINGVPLRGAYPVEAFEKILSRLGK